MPAPVLLQLDLLGQPTGPRWDVIIAALSLGAIYLAFRARADLARSMGFAPADVALLTIGSIAAQVLNVPLATVSGAVFAVNLGGVLVPLILIVRLVRRGTLPLAPALLGAAAVAAVTFLVVDLDPERGAVVAFPDFFLPPAVALAAGLVLGLARPSRAGPIAFAAGSLGALVGADVLLLPDFIQLAGDVAPGTALVVGGAGAFDLVFLSGAAGLALSLLFALVATRRPATDAQQMGPAIRVADPGLILRQVRDLPGLTPRERCLAHLALANQALEGDDPQRATLEAHAALDALLQSGLPRLLDHLRELEDPVLDDLRLIAHRVKVARTQRPAWHEAADTLELAKHVAGRMWAMSIGEVRVGTRP